MSPLYISLCAFLVRCRRSSLLWSGLLLLLGTSLFSGAAVHAQEKSDDKAVGQPPAASGIRFRERPRYPTDMQRLRRTVAVDGVLSDSEWDPFYTIDDGPIKGTIYCNWDDNFLYVAVRADQPANVLLDLDLNGDGWLRGADNLELVVGSAAQGGGASLTARLLDAAGNKDMPTWNETGIDIKTLTVAEKIVNGTQILEIAIPKNTVGLLLRPGAALGLRAELLPPGAPSAYVPTAAFEPHLLLEALLVEARVQAAAGINPRLTLSDYECVPGQTLFATMDLLNQTDLKMGIKNILWTGQGAASVNAVNTIREVNIKPIMGGKRMKLSYRTVLPTDLALGSYMLTCTVELEGGKQVKSAAAFTVIDPVKMQMFSDPLPVAVAGQTQLTVGVVVFSAVPDHLQADVELTKYPAEWKLDGNRKRGLHIDRENAKNTARFLFHLPSTTPNGNYPVEASVLWRGRVWKSSTVVRVLRADTAAPDKP